MVAAVNPNGEPDLFFCKVVGTDKELAEGDHYRAAEYFAEKLGYEPKLSFDENDNAGRAIVDHFVWDSAPIVAVCKDLTPPFISIE